MGHTAAIYRVRVRGAGRGHTSDLYPFGDIDGNGTDLIAVLTGLLDGLVEENVAKEKMVRCLRTTATPDRELQAVVQHGQTGLVADIVDDRGTTRIRQNVRDTQWVKCGALFRLPAAEHIGWLAIHVNNGRGVKGLLCGRLESDFREDFRDRVLEIEPCVSGSALKEAIDADRLEKVKLVRTVQADDLSNPGRKWVPGGTLGKIELDISAKRMVGTRIKNFLNGSDNAFGDIVTFEGMTFEEAKVEVATETGGRRTYNIEKPESGHPMTVDLEGLRSRDGEPSDASLFRALADVLSENVTA
jgi:hypothetical protein